MTSHAAPPSPYLRPTFWAGLAERAIKTAAQVAAAAIGTATVLGDIDWKVIASTCALAVILSALTSIADPDRTDTAIATGTAA